jgi:hypothetical protein
MNILRRFAVSRMARRQSAPFTTLLPGWPIL